MQRIIKQGPAFGLIKLDFSHRPTHIWTNTREYVVGTTKLKPCPAFNSSDSFPRLTVMLNQVSYPVTIRVSLGLVLDLSLPGVQQQGLSDPTVTIQLRKR